MNGFFMFHVTIVTPQKVLFEGEATKVFLQGDEGEFEVLDYHRPVLSLLRKGRVVIDGNKFVVVRGGIARFGENSLVVLAE